MSIYRGKIAFIAGGSGSWGRELARQLLAEGIKQVIIYSRGEISQVAMEREFNDRRVRFVIGDIRDICALRKVFATPIDYVFNLAALKHVPTCENHPHEAILTNVTGVSNLIDVAIEFGVKKFVDVSTDKAVDPANIYGLTKALGERVTIQANALTDRTEFICIRSGNVLGTNGSIVPFIINQIDATNVAKVTDPQMTRFFISFPRVVRFLLHATEVGVGGQTLVINMPSFYIIDLVELLVEFYGDGDTKIAVIGAREGEKTHEALMSEHELPRTYTVGDEYFVIQPEIPTRLLPSYLHRAERRLTSEAALQGKIELSELLQEGGYLI